METAVDGDLITLIPSEFHVTQEDYEEVSVSTGVDSNEVLEAGQSATQEAKVYRFTLNNTTVRLIDTPGIGDTRGIDQDKTNFQNILATLTHVEELHGICILLKPNNARLTVMFRFCITELLTHLHRDASRNIVFCFTNTRGTSYLPGDTLPALRKLLKEKEDVEIALGRNTIYCYDSEAYRYLAAVKKQPPAILPEHMRLNSSISLAKSAEETKRMLEHFRTSPPHDMRSTLNLNHARNIVLNLAGPLAEISKNIQITKKVIEEEKAAIEAGDQGLEDLKKRQMITRTEREIRPLNRRKIQCGDFVRYDYVEPIRKSGGIIVQALCSNCGVPLAQHKLVAFEYVDVVKQYPDKAVIELINQRLPVQETKRKMIEAKDAHIAECEAELGQIEKASVRFAYFLKINAITAYNDALEQYLNHLIREEENVVTNGGSDAILERLKQSLESYQKEKELLEQQFNVEEEIAEQPGPEDIDRLVKELQGLKHSGKDLKEALECVQHGHDALYNETVVNLRKMGEADQCWA